MSFVVLNSIPSKATLLESPGAPSFSSLVVNPGGAGNNRFDLVFTRNIETPVLGDLAGFSNGTGKIEVGFGGSYSTLDLSAATTAIVDNKIQVTLGGARTFMSSTHAFRVSYDDTQGDVRNVSGGAVLATFSNDTNYSNGSSIDTTSNVVGSGGGWYPLDEGSGATREPFDASLAASWDMADVGTVGVRTGPDGATNAADFSGSNYLTTSSGDDWTVPSNGKFTICGYIIVDTLPSVLAAGDSYPIDKWATTNSRNWTFFMGASGANQDNLALVGMNSDNQTFRQDGLVRGDLTTGIWYWMAAVFDPTNTTNPIILYTQQLNTPGDFTVDDDNYVAPGSGTGQVKSTGGRTGHRFGRLPVGGVAGFDGGLADVMLYHRALTQAECVAIAEGYAQRPFFPSTL